MKLFIVILLFSVCGLACGREDALVKLKFQDNSTNEEWWECERMEVGVDEAFALLLRWDSTTSAEKEVRIEFEDVAAEPGHVYKYRVRAGNHFGPDGQVGYSGYSKTLTVTASAIETSYDFDDPPNAAPSYLSEQEKDTL